MQILRPEGLVATLSSVVEVEADILLHEVLGTVGLGFRVQGVGFRRFGV